ncbi:uncharacterized protein [Amphiura filiformis]|uniref:uncharacterized protein n=1 Tax=Amphiura filiformis TaxID=82378 RepID=UPI003B21DA14
MMKFLWSLLVLAVMFAVASAMAFADERELAQDDTDTDTLLEDETPDKRGFHNFMDPLSAGFANKRFNQFMDPLQSGFSARPYKRRFNSFMDPLMAGFNPSKRFNSFMDPLNAGFSNFPNKRFQTFMDPLSAGFHVKRDDD